MLTNISRCFKCDLSC